MWVNETENGRVFGIKEKFFYIIIPNNKQINNPLGISLVQESLFDHDKHKLYIPKIDYKPLVVKNNCVSFQVVKDSASKVLRKFDYDIYLSMGEIYEIDVKDKKTLEKLNYIATHGYINNYEVNRDE